MKYQHWRCGGDKDSETLSVARDGDGSLRVKPRILVLAAAWTVVPVL